MDVTVAMFALKRREINVEAFGIQMGNVEAKTYAFCLKNETVCLKFLKYRYRESKIKNRSKIKGLICHS